METFVVRVWNPAEAAYAAEPALRGTVSHVMSGRSAPFVGAEQLLAFLVGEREREGEERASAEG